MGFGVIEEIEDEISFGVGVENENNRKMIDFCANRGMCVSNTFFDYKNIHQYKRVGVGRYGIEIKGMFIWCFDEESYAEIREDF